MVHDAKHNSWREKLLHDVNFNNSWRWISFMTEKESTFGMTGTKLNRSSGLAEELLARLMLVVGAHSGSKSAIMPPPRTSPPFHNAANSRELEDMIFGFYGNGVSDFFNLVAHVLQNWEVQFTGVCPGVWRCVMRLLTHNSHSLRVWSRERYVAPRTRLTVG